VRRTVVEGQTLCTAAQGSEFTVARLLPDHLVLLLGRTEAWTPLGWKCLEGVPDFLHGRDWVTIASRWDTSSDPGTLDGYLKCCIKRATAAYVAAVLNHAGVVEINRGRPAQARLRSAFC